LIACKQSSNAGPTTQVRHIGVTPTENEALEWQTAARDGQINELVYELYGLTAEEIAILEKAEN